MSELSAESLKTIGLLILAGIGGMLGYVSRELRMGRKLGAMRVIFAGLTAMFFAYLIKVAVLKFGWDIEYAIILAGLLSWAGADIAANFLMRLVLKKMGIGYGYYKLDAAEEIPNTIGSCDYLRADVFDSISKVRESQITAGDKPS